MGETVSEIVEEVTALLKSPAGQAKIQQLNGHHDRVAQDREVILQEIRRVRRAARRGPTEVGFYGSVGALTRGEVTIDVRIAGTSCGTIALVPGKEERRFTARNFGDLSCNWEDAAVLEYLEHAQPRVRRSREASVEAALLVEMSKTEGATKPTPLLRHQPVKLVKLLPFQFPLPISAREDVKIALGNRPGYADVLARGPGGRKLRVFEVKTCRADDNGHALDQAVAYCAALEHLMSTSTNTYLTAFGMGARPRTLRFDAVAFVEGTPDAKRDVEQAACRLAEGGTRFGLMAQFFSWKEKSASRTLVLERNETVYFKASPR